MTQLSRDEDELRTAPDYGVDDLHADVRSEGVPLAASRRTILASIAQHAPVAYAGAVVLRDSPHPFVMRIAIAAVALITLRRLAARVDDLAVAARTPARTALSAGLVAAMLAGSLPGRSSSSIASIATLFAATIAAAASVRCAAAVAGLGGLGAAREGRSSGGLLVAASWIAGSVYVAAPALVARVLNNHPSIETPSDLSRSLVAIAVAAVTVAHLIRARTARQYELGALERLEVLLGASTLALPATTLVAIALDPDHATLTPSVAFIAIGLALTTGTLVAQLAADPVAVAARIGEAWIALVAGFVAWIGLVVATDAPPRSVPTHTLVAGVLIGLFAGLAARLFGLAGEGHARIQLAIARTRASASTRDVRDLERGVLSAMRELTGYTFGPVTPRLIGFAPLREVTLDAAGEPRARDPLPGGEEVVPDPDAPSQVSRVVPTELLDLVRTEPFGVVRTAVLQSLEIRRPDLRAALRWCTQMEASAVIGLVDDGELEGVLVVPDGEGTKRIGLQHVRALRTIARVVTTRLALESALARAAARTHRAERRTRETEQLLERATHREDRAALAIAGSAKPFADRIATTGYAPGSRALLADLDALARTQAHLLLAHRPGTDPVPYAARLHLASGRRGAFHVVDATRRQGSDPLRWNDPVASPIELARDGTLIVLGAHRLPEIAQKALVRALAFQTGPGSDPTPIDLRLVLAVPCDDPVGHDAAALAPALEPALFGRLREPPIRVPPLAARIEDLRALALERLAALGIASHGDPLGLAGEALALLVEHPWPGDDLELDAVLVAAAAVGRGPRVERADVAAVLGSGDKSK